MDFFKSLFGGRTADDTTAPARPDVEALAEEYREEAKPHLDYQFDVSSLQSVEKISNSPGEVQIAVLKYALQKQTELPVGPTEISHNKWKALSIYLFKKSLPYTRADILAMLSLAPKLRGGVPPLVSMIGMIERYVMKNGLNDEVRKAIDSLLVDLEKRGSSDYNKHARKVRLIIASVDSSVPFRICAKEAWGARAMADIKAMNDQEQLAWKELLEHAIKCSGSTPTAKWSKAAAAVIDRVGKEAFVNHVTAWLPLIGTKGTKSPDAGRYHPDRSELLEPDSQDTLKGLVWMCSVHEDDRLAQAVGDAGEASFKKIANHGMRSTKIGNACVGSLASMTTKEAVAQLGRLKSKAKHSSSRAQVDKGLVKAADKAGMSVQDLEELNVPTHGFQQVGLMSEELGNCKAEILITGSDAELKWSVDGKYQKSVPTKVKQEHATELKALKKSVSNVEKLIQTLKHRIESSYIGQRRWTLANFRERYMQHPIAATLARRLIWSINGRAAIWCDGQFVDATGCGVDSPDDASVELWHPISSDADEVLQWRQYLYGHEIMQPFKQAHREIYVLTDAERATGTYSNRFAAHILRQHQFTQLCQQRGWRYTLQGAWDSYNTPHLVLEQWNLVAQFFVEAIAEGHTESFIFLHCATDQVRVHRLNHEAVPLVEILPIVFTEVMRDVDLFVGVCSIGNDPNWRDSGDQQHHGYWHDFSFGDLTETAQTRKQVLKEIVPMLKIASRCEFDDKFLIVRGDIRTYKIHLGSGNIQMEPNNQYLCIVPDRGAGGGVTEKVFLPFEGDGILSVILSKAFMLADDTKITDPSIVSQIRR